LVAMPIGTVTAAVVREGVVGRVLVAARTRMP
jgi:hypothetical protein